MVPRGEIEPSGFVQTGYAGTSFCAADSVGCGVTEFDGARGRDRTTDTAIFSRMLYQLSYPGMSRRGAGSAGL
jgi:hypothetical protein